MNNNRWDKLTVIIRNDGPMLFCGDAPTYRRVTFDLTDKQKEQIKLDQVGVSCGDEIWEKVSKCFLE